VLASRTDLHKGVAGHPAKRPHRHPLVASAGLHDLKAGVVDNLTVETDGAGTAAAAGARLMHRDPVGAIAILHCQKAGVGDDFTLDTGGVRAIGMRKGRQEKKQTESKKEIKRSFYCFSIYCFSIPEHHDSTNLSFPFFSVNH
jgi:hypothetical protein